MYSFIKGNLVSCSPDIAVVENNGIGYEINISESTYARICGSKEVKIYTYLNVKEDGIALFGFYSQNEKDLFMQLTSISGVGPKTALQVLSAGDVTSLAVAIASGDVAFLSKIKGIGKKTAERIVLELRSSMVSIDVVGDSIKTPVSKAEKNVMDEAVMALVSLGLSKTECVKAVSRVEEYKSLEDLIAKALKFIGR